MITYVLPFVIFVLSLMSLFLFNVLRIRKWWFSQKEPFHIILENRCFKRLENYVVFIANSLSQVKEIIVFLGSVFNSLLVVSKFSCIVSYPITLLVINTFSFLLKNTRTIATLKVLKIPENNYFFQRNAFGTQRSDFLLEPFTRLQRNQNYSL